MPGLVPGIHVFRNVAKKKAWMAGTSPAMTLYFLTRRLNLASSRTKASKRAFAANSSRSVSTSSADDADAHRNSARCARSPRSVKVRMREDKVICLGSTAFVADGQTMALRSGL